MKPPKNPKDNNEISSDEMENLLFAIYNNGKRRLVGHKAPAIENVIGNQR